MAVTRPSGMDLCEDSKLRSSTKNNPSGIAERELERHHEQ